MNAHQPSSRILGFAFLLQFFTSLAGALILNMGLVVPGDTAATLLHIAARPWLLRVNILDEMLAAFPLIALGSQFAATPSVSRLAEADRTLASMNFSYTLLLLAFCPGALLFYWLLFKSRLVPRALSLWGFITVIPLFFAISLSILGINVPFYIVYPYFPFEFVIGVWILIKGVKTTTT